MSFCYTLEVHSVSFTISLKLSLCAQYQECYDRFTYMTLSRVVFSKMLENAI